MDLKKDRNQEDFKKYEIHNTFGENDRCHGWMGLLDHHASLVMHSPGVFAVYWGSYFKANPATVDLMNHFFQSILSGPYMDGLMQYGIGKGRLLGSVVVEDISQNPLNEGDIQSHLDRWLDNRIISEQPSFDTLYVIFTPPGIELTVGNSSSKRGMGGYHGWGFFHNPGFGKATKFYAPIPWLLTTTSPTPSQFAMDSTFRVSHEMVEAFSDRDGNGFKNSDGCEIGDVCEAIPSVIVGRWKVVRYWSDSNQACVPVSDLITLEDGSVIKNDATQQTDVIYGGAKFFISGFQLFSTQNASYNLGLIDGAEITVSDGFYRSIPDIPKDGTLLRRQSGSIYIIYGGAKFGVPDLSTLTRLFTGFPVGQLRWDSSFDGIPNIPFTGIPDIPKDGTLLREESGSIYIIYGGAKFGVPDLSTLTRIFTGFPVGQLWNGALDSIPDIPKDGTLLREESGSIYIIYGGAKFHIPSTEFYALNLNMTNVRRVWDGALVTMPIVPRDGTVLKERTTNSNYVIIGGQKHLIENFIVLMIYGGQTVVRVVPVGALASIPTGSPAGFFTMIWKRVSNWVSSEDLKLFHPRT